jgi:hypothetical protein
VLNHSVLDQFFTDNHGRLRRHIRDGVNRKILSSITEYGCQWNFIDWVENYRSPDPYIDEDELRMCPLIWCRKTFESKESVVSHVFECPRLSNAWYWCPYHKRPERYLECNRLCDTIPKIRIRNKEYKLRLADKFLNWICRKRFEKRSGEYSASESSKNTETNQLVLSKPTSMNK